MRASAGRDPHHTPVKWDYRGLCAGREGVGVRWAGCVKMGWRREGCMWKKRGKAQARDRDWKKEWREEQKKKGLERNAVE